MTDSIYKLKTGYSIAADGDYVAVGNPTSFLSGSFVLNNKGELIKSSGYQSANQLALKLLNSIEEAVLVIKIKRNDNV